MPAFDVQAFLRATDDEHINVLDLRPCGLLAGDEPAELRRLRHEQHRLGHLRRRTDSTRRRRAPAHLRSRMRGWPTGLASPRRRRSRHVLPDEDAESRPETVGLAAPPVEVDLLDPDPATGVGELLIRGQNVVAGYWNNPGKTAETFVDGWLHTGDLARIDDDGFVQIVDRRKDMICRGGENVYCVEVENVLAQHPAVFEAAVLGVPDEMMGEKVGAVVVPRRGRTPTQGDPDLRQGTDRGLQRAAVRLLPKRSAAAQPGRQSTETSPAQ